MTGASRGVLYSPELLALAVELADYPFDPASALQGHARSRACGSEVTLSHSGSDALEAPGLRVSACAVGQAAAAIFAGDAQGRTSEDIETILAGLRLWLAGEGAMPDWPRIGRLQAALPHAGRHEAILLPWRAALDALSKNTPAR